MRGLRHALSLWYGRMLNRIRHIRTEDGALVISGPCWHDADRTHVGIHSPVMVRRILEDAGFSVEEQVLRGRLAQIYVRVLHGPHLLINLLLSPRTGRTVFAFVNRCLFRLNVIAVDWERLPDREQILFGMSCTLNGYAAKARKSGASVDVSAIGREKAANMSPEEQWTAS